MMNDGMDQFERRLSRQPVRQIPAGWREEILAAARNAAGANPAARVPSPSFLSTLNRQLSTILWPHPAAWAGLTAIWILILAVDFSIRDRSSVVTEKSVPPTPEVVAELRQQQRMLAELIGPRDTREADRSKTFVPQPRSEREDFVAA
jgi:hypothetical protein